MSKRRRRFTPEFKTQAVELAQAGRPVSELAIDLEVGSCGPSRSSPRCVTRSSSERPGSPAPRGS